MKRFFLIAVVLMVLQACEQEVSPEIKDTEKAVTNLRKIDNEFVAQSNDFSFRLLDQVIAESPNDKNILISPLSINIALGMLLNGAKGNTAEQIMTTLGLTELDTAVINVSYRSLLDALPNLDNKVNVGIANSVWHDQDFQVKDQFLQNLKVGFDADINASDFANSGTVDLINNWVNTNTNGLIKKIMDSISPEEVMFLINTLYFKGDWTTQFDKANTTTQKFTNANGVEKEVAMMMHQKIKVKGTGGEGYAIFELPYGENELYALRILLPNPDKTLEEILGSNSDLAWNGTLALGSESEATIGLPRFEIRDEYTLNNILQQMGITDVFSESKADLSNISDQQLNVSQVKHKTYMKVDESGTEAAAVTSIGLETTSLPPQYICNRPFAFYIYEREMGNILFMGKVVDVD